MMQTPKDRPQNGLFSTSNSDFDRCLSSYDYPLPEKLIAQNPAVPRDTSRLLVVKSPGDRLHQIFRDLPKFLRSGDLLIMNNTRVIPARLYGQKSTGTPIEILLLEPRQPHIWLALVKPGKRLKPGTTIIFSPPTENQANTPKTANFPLTNTNPLTAKVLATDPATGGRILQFEIPPETDFNQLLTIYGHVPLPPYISDSQSSPEQYQTVYAECPGSVAAPTAGLHFTEELLNQLENQGINRAFVTLNIGVGTFRPVEVEDITTHNMHQEWVQVPPETVEKIQETKAKGGRIIAVGTTAVRSLEGAAISGELKPFYGETNLFIYPGYKWQVVEGLITNFHLPKSSLLMLLSALIGRENLLNIYQEAIEKQYRFYSFGDAMLILPEARN